MKRFTTTASCSKTAGFRRFGISATYCATWGARSGGIGKSRRTSEIADRNATFSSEFVGMSSFR